MLHAGYTYLRKYMMSCSGLSTASLAILFFFFTVFTKDSWFFTVFLVYESKICMHASLSFLHLIRRDKYGNP